MSDECGLKGGVGEHVGCGHPSTGPDYYSPPCHGEATCPIWRGMQAQERIATALEQMFLDKRARHDETARVLARNIAKVILFTGCMAKQDMEGEYVFNMGELNAIMGLGGETVTEPIKTVPPSENFGTPSP